MISKKTLSADQYNSILEILALIAWKIELQEQKNEKSLKLALNTVASVAESFAFKPFETNLKNDLKPYLESAINSPGKIDEFNNVHSIREKLRDVVRLILAMAEPNEVRVFSDFVYRFAYRLSEVSGSTFSGLGKKLDADEATILLEIKEELPH